MKESVRELMFNDEVYQNEYGSCAFVAGVIEVLTGDLGVAMYKAGVRYEALAADVICIPTDAEFDINELVCERLQKLIMEEGNPESVEKQLEEAKELHIETVASPKSMKDAIMDLYCNSQWKIDRDELEEAINNFCREVEYYLGKPKEVFMASINKDEVMRYVYYSILFDIVFVRFEKHLLMLVRGSTE